MSDAPKRGWLSFSIRDLMFLTVIVALAVALVYVKWPSGQGRYQFAVDEAHHNLYIFDSATGRCWRKPTRGYGGEWTSEPSPDVTK